MDAEQRLKERIERILSLAGFNQARATNELKDQILELFREYNNASAERKADVYARGEKRIIRSLLTTQAAAVEGSAQPKRAFHSKMSR